MGCSTKGKTSFFSKLGINKISDDSIINGNVLFWNNGESLILTSGCSCQLYSVNTGEYLEELFRCKSTIISCHYHPGDNNVIYTLSELGELVKYELKSHTVVSRIDLKFQAKILNSHRVPKFSVNKKFYLKSDCDKNYVWDDALVNDSQKRKFFYGVPIVTEDHRQVLIWTSWSLNEEYQSHVSVFIASTGELLLKISLPRTGFKKCYKNFSVCQTIDKNILFVGMGSNFVRVCHYNDGNLATFVGSVHLLGNDVEVTSLILHPRMPTFATADSRGLINVWQNILEKYPLKEKLVWHPVQIRDMAFSNEGSHLFSGGDEHVLVKWSFQSNKKNFLPRLSSPICYITVGHDVSLVAISLADNEIFIIDSNFEKISVIKKCSRYIPPKTVRCYDILTVEPRNEQIVLNGRPGHLQFLSYKKSLNLMYSLDVGRVNYMTGDEQVVNMQVTHAMFSKNGSLLVTAEARKDPLLKEYRLKFWEFDETKQCFTMNTQIELPHDENDIYLLEVGSDDLVATSGGDGQFKLWTTFESSELTGTKTVWSFLNGGKYKCLPCGPLDFCKDTTLIAVAFGPALTLWSTSDCTVKCSLIPPFKRDNLTFVKFGSEDHSHLIVTATDFGLTAWNIITLTVVWTVDLEVSYLVSDFFNTYMCAFSKSNSLFIFTPATTSPELVMESVSQSKIVAAQAFSYSKNEASPFYLYFLNAEHELFCLQCKDESMEEDLVNDMNTHVTPFSAQLAERTGGDVQKSVADYVPTKMKKDLHYLSSIMDAPAHALPNPVRFCYNFLQCLTDSVVKSDEASTKSKEQSLDSDVIEIVNKNDSKKNVDDISSEELLWTTVNDLFK